MLSSFQWSPIIVYVVIISLLALFLIGVYYVTKSEMKKAFVCIVGMLLFVLAGFFPIMPIA